MAIKSLIHEILGLSNDELHPAESLSAFEGTARVLVIFEDSPGELLKRQDALLSIDALRALDVVVVHVDGRRVQVSKRPTTLRATNIRSELDGPEIGRFEVVLIDRNASVVTRSNTPLAIEDIAQIVATLADGDDQSSAGWPDED
ncbi:MULTISPECIES: hypothetical protein [unclassified Sinorhizobium]|uniref:hypothetical protein n=1 Tax=unclassified Sinorhizobium TaxID=2613772 RepID=UPI003525187C